MGGVIDMRRFRAAPPAPLDLWTFPVGGWASPGSPFSGFFSKDQIMAGLNLASEPRPTAGGARGHSTRYLLDRLITAGLTAFYTGRAFFLTFFGPEKLPSPDDPEAEPKRGPRRPGTRCMVTTMPSAHHPIGHESPPLMVYPLVVLAVCAALAGLVFGPTHLFEHHLARTLGFESLAQVTHAPGWLTPVLATIAGLGLGLSY